MAENTLTAVIQEAHVRGNLRSIGPALKFQHHPQRVRVETQQISAFSVVERMPCRDSAVACGVAYMGSL